MQENPVLLEQDLGGRVDETGFSVIGGVEDFPGHLIGRSEHNEAGIGSMTALADTQAIGLTHMLKTETADKAPEYHCFL